MSYDIELCDPVTHETLQADSPHQMRGGTYQVGGTTDMWLNVTYNFGKYFRKAFEGFTCGPDLSDPWRTALAKEPGYLDGSIRALYGHTGGESIPMLKTAISRLGDEMGPDYWHGGEGRAKQALCQLLAMARMRPDGVWDGD